MHFLQAKKGSGSPLVCAGRIQERIKFKIFKGFGLLGDRGVHSDEVYKFLPLQDLCCNNFLLDSLPA
jgi:hypothetical protein